jgi:hypothetical protein
MPLLQLRPEIEPDSNQESAGAAPFNIPAWANFAGKLFMKKPDGTDHYCTAMFVDANVILTAAHCVRENGSGTDHTNFAFEQATGSTFAISCFVAHDDWAGTTDKHLRVRFDYAFMQTSTALGSPPVNKPSVKNPYGETVDILGYPASGMMVIKETIGRDVLFPHLVWVRTMETGFGAGTSGGPWVDEIPNRKRIYSINSSYAPVLYDNSYINIYGPRFDDQMPLYLAAAKNEDCNPL